MEAKADDRYMNGHPKSDKNYITAARVFIVFMLKCKISFRNVRPKHLWAYLEYLNSYYAPATVAIYFSHAKTYIALAHQRLHALSHKSVKRALRSVKQNKAFKSRATIPLSISQMNKVIKAIPKDRNHDIFVFSLSLMLVCAWRRSNVAPDSVAAFDPDRHLCHKMPHNPKPSLVLKVDNAFKHTRLRPHHWW